MLLVMLWVTLLVTLLVKLLVTVLVLFTVEVFIDVGAGGTGFRLLFCFLVETLCVCFRLSSFSSAFGPTNCLTPFQMLYPLLVLVLVTLELVELEEDVDTEIREVVLTSSLPAPWVDSEFRTVKGKSKSR